MSRAIVIALTVCALLALPARGAAPKRSSVAVTDIVEWLAHHPTLRKHMVWTSGDGKKLPFERWEPELKERFETFYKKMAAGDRELGMRLFVHEKTHGFFPADYATDLYAAHVAHVLYLEANHVVPWSIESRPAVELDKLLASASYMSRIRPTSHDAGYHRDPKRDFIPVFEDGPLGEYTSDPRIGYDFVTGKTANGHKSLIGKDEWETISNLTIWLRDNVDHGPYPDPHRSVRAVKLRWLDDRLRPFEGQKTAMANAGCHSAAKLMVDLARSVNIPLLHTEASENDNGEPAQPLQNYHGGLVYGWGGKQPRIVWHADTIYARDGRICFPLDEKTGEFLPQKEADRLYVERTWLSPAEWEKHGFVYRLEFLKTAADEKDGALQIRYDSGTKLGYWKPVHADLSELFDLDNDYALCGEPIVNMAAKRIVEAQLKIILKKYEGKASPEDLPPMETLQQFNERAGLALKALGGPERFKEVVKERKDARGSHLLAEGVRYERPK